MDTLCQKFRKPRPKNRKYWLLNPSSKLLSTSFSFMDCLKLIWCFVVKSAMWSLSVVKFYIIIDTFYELLLWFVLCAIDFFALHRSEKRLHDSIVMRLTRRGERLDNLVYPQQFAECLWGILCSLVAVKQQRLRGISALECLLECWGDQISTVLRGYSVGYYLSGKEIKDCTDIQVFAIDFKAGHIADPNSVWLICLEFPLEKILLFSQSFFFLIISFRMASNTLQAHLLH